MNSLVKQDLSVINIGLASFAEAIAVVDAPVTHVNWTPPGADPLVARVLADLAARDDIARANDKAFSTYLAAEPVLEGIGIAREVVPGMGERMIMHSGPPVRWERMGGTMRGAMIGAILLEGWAKDEQAARAMAEAGEIEFDSCHHHNAVGPMAGVTSPSMPMWIVRNTVHGNRAFCNLNEGLGKVLRYGANGPDVIARLKWMGATLSPILARALEKGGPIEIKPLMARALHMGDEMHNRNQASSALLLKRLAPPVLRAGVSSVDVAAVFDFINGNDHFFLNVCMAACKAMLDAAAGVPGSSMVVAMARNGTEFGIRVSGTGNRWFVAPARVADGLFFAGYSRVDAGADIGDSAITETAGIGGFAMAASPAIVQFVGGTTQQALRNTLTMRHITLGTNGAFTLPTLDFASPPAGIDIRKVVDTGILPVINTGIAHKEPGIGQIGAGITYAPLSCFTEALLALAQSSIASQSGAATR